jgi:hypothetical protein
MLGHNWFPILFVDLSFRNLKSDMAKKIHLKKSAKGQNRRGEQVTPERLMELSFAYAPPVIIGAGVSNKVFGSLEDGAKTSPYVPSATAPRGWHVPVPHGQKTASRRAIFGQKRCLPAFPPSPTQRERSRLANALCFNGNFVPAIPVQFLKAA